MVHPAAIIVPVLVLFIALLGLMFYYVPYCPSGYYVDRVMCVPLGDTYSKPSWSNVLASPAYIINLDRSPERLATAKERVASAGFTDIRRHRGVDGKKDDLPSSWKEHYPGGTRFIIRDPWNPREQGCMLSWLSMLKAIATGPDPIATVFEDDIVFHEEWKNAKTYYDETPSDFDMVFLGSQTTYAIGTNRILRTPAYCFHAMLFTRVGAQKFYDFLTSSPVQYTIDSMLYDHTFNDNPRAFTHYVWNYKDPKYLFTGFRGLAYQDKATFPSTIQTL